MRILVFGRDGQVARSLKERASRFPNLEIFALGRPDVDLQASGSAAEAVSSTSPDLVINAAAYTAVDRAEDEPEIAFRINAGAAGEIAEAAARVSVPLIHISTDYVFDGTGTGAYDEQAECNPLNVYGRFKLAGERKVVGASDRHLIIRTSWVYSPFGRNFVKVMMDAAEAQEAVDVVDDQTGCPTSAADLAEALLTLAQRSPASGIYHLAGEGSTSWCGFARHIMAERRSRGLQAAGVRPLASEEWPTKAVRPKNSALDCDLFFRTFGIRLPDWRHSVGACVARLAVSEAR